MAGHQTLVDLLEDAAARHPERTCVVDPFGGRLSYRALAEGAARVAGFLRERGVRRGDRVGLVARKSEAAVVTLFGIMKAGAAYVPADYTAPAERNHRILTDCDVKVAFLDPACAPIGEAPLDAAFDRVVLPVPGAAGAPQAGPWRWDEVVAHAPVREPETVEPADLAYVLYTSGSTGVPKGVMLTHRNAVSFVDWCSDVFTPTAEDRFSSHAPFHFDLSVLDLYVSVKHGATLFLVSETLGKSPQELAAFIAANRLTVWYSTPSILTLLAQYGNLAALDCSSLRLVLFAGEVFPVKHLRALKALWPAPKYYNLYGPTETNVCTFARIPAEVPEDRVEPYPIGPACAHCAPLVLDEQGREVARGSEGLLYISGPSVFQGYWNRPAENARAFVERPDGRWYNTGDVVREDPDVGFIYRGRRDRMIKRRGYRIELGEVERVLYRHERVAEAAVIAVPDEASGVRMIANLAVRGEGRPSIIEMKTFCAGHLPAYMTPDQFVFREALPRTSTDKVDYQALGQLAAAGR